MRRREPHSAERPVEPLTRREREILALLAHGLSGSEIAEKLTLAKSSVKWHLRQLYGKLGVNSKEQAIRRAQELGLLETPGAPAVGKPPVTPPPALKHNLPLQVTRFFGRETEISQLKARLAEHRLVTLTGSGGVGKTRLSLATAEAVLPDFPDGVWLVELAPLSDPGLIPPPVASVLGLKEEPDRLILATLIDHLRGKRALLILDNCEHLIQASAQFADAVLRACPHVCLLASSRELLGVAGERTFPVPSLQTPEPNQDWSLEQLSHCESVRLFLDRAASTAPQFALSRDNAAAVAAVCRRLDGIPLALELAAARLRMMPVEQ